MPRHFSTWLKTIWLKTISSSKPSTLTRERKIRACARSRSVSAPPGRPWKLSAAMAKRIATCARWCASTFRSWSATASARNRQRRLWRPGRIRALSRHRYLAARGRQRDPPGAGQSRAVPAPAGEMDVVLGPGWPGVMLHEAVGHGLEGDFNRKKTSAFAGLMGQLRRRQRRHGGR